MISYKSDLVRVPFCFYRGNTAGNDCSVIVDTDDENRMLAN